MNWLIYGCIARFAYWRWGDVENPNWIQSLALYPEDVKGRRQVFWQILMVAAEWAERFSQWIQGHFNDATGGEWAEIMADFSEDG